MASRIFSPAQRKERGRVCEAGPENKSGAIFITIPGLPPSVNNSYRAAKGKARHCLFYKKKEVKKWQAMATGLLEEAVKGLDVPFIGKLKLKIVCYTKNNRRMDVDNRIKAVQDCLQAAGVIKDDSQIWDVRAVRVMADNEHTNIVLEEY